MTVQTIKITKKQRAVLEHLVRLNGNITFRFNNRPSNVAFETDEATIILSELESIKAILTPSQYAKLRMMFDDTFTYTPRTRRTVVATPVATPVVEVAPVIVQEPVIEKPVEESKAEEPAPEPIKVILSDVAANPYLNKVDSKTLEEATRIVNFYEDAAASFSKLFKRPETEYPISEENKSLYRKCKQTVEAARGNLHRDSINQMTKEEHDSMLVTQTYNQMKQEAPVDTSLEIVEVKSAPVQMNVQKPEGLKVSAVANEIAQKQQQNPAMSTSRYDHAGFNPSIPKVDDVNDHQFADDEISSARSYVTNMQRFIDEQRGGPDYVMPEHTKIMLERKRVIAKCKLSTERR